MTKRHQESEPTKQFIRKSMSEILADLASNPDISGIEVEYEVDGKVTAEQLQSLLDLPYEVAITEKAGKLVLTPLTFQKNQDNPEYLDRQTKSRLWVHTHKKRPDGIVVDTPSLQDILVSTVVSDDTNMIVAHGRGITRFGKIKKHPVTGTEVSTTYISGFFSEYQDHISAVLSRRYETPDQPFVNDKYSHEERIRLAKEFIRNSGMLLDEADWQDSEGVERLLKSINLEE